MDPSTARFDHPCRVPDVIDYRLSRDDVQRRMARVRTSGAHGRWVGWLAASAGGSSP